MIKCVSILLFIILTGVIIWLVITRTQDSGHATKDYTSTVCWNFNFSLSNKAYLPSDVIALSGSCDNANGTTAFCPFWNITSAVADVKVLHDNTVQDGTGCIHMTKIQVANFKTPRKRINLLVEFNYPKGEPAKEINIERSDDGESCHQDRDCHFLDQLCSPLGSCTCAERWIFIRNIQKCVPAIYKVKEHCQFTAQCQIPNSVCHSNSCECIKYYTPALDSAECIPEAVYEVKGHCLFTSQCKIPNSVCYNNSCECNKYYTPAFDSTQCIPEDRDCGESCLIHENCQIKNEDSVCKMNRCECRESYTYSYDSRRARHPNGAASSKAGFGWTIVLLVVAAISMNKNK